MAKITFYRAGQTIGKETGKKYRWNAGDTVEEEKAGDLKHVGNDKKLKPAIDFKKKDT